MPVSISLDANIRVLKDAFADCGDYVGRKFPAGGTAASGQVWLYMAYIDMMTDRNLIDLSVMNRLFEMDLTAERAESKGIAASASAASASAVDDVFRLLRDSGLPTADLKESDDVDSIINDMLAGDTALFMEGHARAIVIATKGFPSRGVNAAETEVVVQGPKESFSEAFRVNTALVRRRIRDPQLKVKQTRVGVRSQTDIALMYLSDLVRPAVLEAVEGRLAAIETDGIPDSGALEQWIDDNWRSPFPQAQLTERPDKAAASILEGRIVIIVDGSPFVLVVPVTMNVFFQASEDYYNRWQIMSAARLLRFAAAFLAVALPGFYIAAAVYHPSMIPLLMVMKMGAARQAVPFPAIVEILLMDAAFELLREAGVRLPGSAGGTIGIVGGLIIGQAAVEAGLVSPIVVIIVALAGIASFAVPHVSLMNGFRIMKYAVLLLSSVLGLLGFWAGLLIGLTHLASLRSFGVPYLLPFAAGEMNRYGDVKDSVVREPLFMLSSRPFFSNPKQTKRAPKHSNNGKDR